MNARRTILSTGAAAVALRVALLLALAVAAIACSSGTPPDRSTGRSSDAPASGRPSATATAALGFDKAIGLPLVALADLPSERAETVALIDAGGPFPYE